MTSCEHDYELMRTMLGHVFARRCRRCLKVAEPPKDLHEAPDEGFRYPRGQTRPGRPVKECEWCGDNYVPRKNPDHMTEWVERRYCGRECYYDDLEDRRATGRELVDPGLGRRRDRRGRPMNSH